MRIAVVDDFQKDRDQLALDVEEYLKSYGWTTDAISVDVSKNDVNSVTTGFDEGRQVIISKVVDKVGNIKYYAYISVAKYCAAGYSGVFNIKIV